MQAPASGFSSGFSSTFGPTVSHVPASIANLREIVADLREPKARIYFLDVGLSALVGWLLFAVAASGLALGWRALAFVGCALCMYRALAFIHELFHQQALKGFRLFGPAVVGVPLLLPFLL